MSCMSINTPVLSMLPKPALGLCPPLLTANLVSTYDTTFKMIATSKAFLGRTKQAAGSQHVWDLAVM